MVKMNFIKTIKKFHNAMRNYPDGVAYGNTLGFWGGMGSTYYTYTQGVPQDISYLFLAVSPFAFTSAGTYLGRYIKPKTQAGPLTRTLFHSAPLRHFYFNVGFFAVCASRYITDINSAPKVEHTLSRPKP